MKILFLLLPIGLAVSVGLEASVRFQRAGYAMFQEATHVSLVQYTSVVVRQDPDGGQTYSYAITNQIRFKGESLPARCSIAAPDFKMFPDGYKYVPQKPSFALLFLRKGRHPALEFVGTAMDQCLIEPEITVPLSSFRSFSDFILYLLQSTNKKSREIGLVYASAAGTPSVREELKKIAKTGSDEDRGRAQVALMDYEEMAKKPPVTEAEASRILKECRSVFPVWQKHWNNSDWKAFVDLDAARAWETRSPDEKREIIAQLDELRRTRGEIVQVEIMESKAAKTSCEFTVEFIYSGGLTNQSNLRFSQQPDGQWKPHIR